MINLLMIKVCNLTPLKILSLLASSDLMSHLAAVMYKCTPGLRLLLGMFRGETGLERSTNLVLNKSSLIKKWENILYIHFKYITITYNLLLIL